eukprot:m.526765 g.526765  ORF g.526765 m.526765 type:complete len:381 (-) comp22004_c0_seq8:315-1457(-)
MCQVFLVLFRTCSPLVGFSAMQNLLISCVPEVISCRVCSRSDYNGCTNLRKYVNSDDPSPPCTLLTPLAGAQLAFPHAEVLYEEGCTLNTSDSSRIQSAVRAAKDADVAVVVVGLVSGDGFSGKLEGEAFDRVSISLPGRQRELVDAVVAVQPHTIVVFMSGGPITEPTLLPWNRQRSPGTGSTPAALVQQFYPGEMGGVALFDVLGGAVSFSGRLPVSIPKSLDDVPKYLDQNMSLGKGRTYRYAEADALFPFGYGQGYHMAAYANVHVTPAVVQRGMTQAITVTADVSLLEHRLAATTMSDEPVAAQVSVEEVVQVYVERTDGRGVGSFRPLAELKGFQRVALNTTTPHRAVTITVPVAALSLMGDDDHYGLIRCDRA